MKEVVLAFMLVLQGCSSLELAKEGVDLLTGDDDNGSLSVDTELVIGDKQEQVNTQLGDKHDIRSESITGGVTINEGIPWWIVACGIGLFVLSHTVAYFIPSPFEKRRKNDS